MLIKVMQFFFDSLVLSVKPEEGIETGLILHGFQP